MQDKDLLKEVEALQASNMVLELLVSQLLSTLPPAKQREVFAELDRKLLISNDAAKESLARVKLNTN